MSESTGDPAVTTLGASTAPVAPTASSVPTPSAVPAVHEAYAFACLNCGFGWEQEYEIEHRADTKGVLNTVYRANGVPVPSPLTKPACPGCGGSHVRIMRAGRIAEASAYWHIPQHPAPSDPVPPPEVVHAPTRPRRERRLHLPFHFHMRRHHGTPEA
ncbi:hypothetical protein ABIA33_001025 [Streptacidiphilus sp. MAP12-16]|jgi:hypothetical protein|uniref:hypothetical protein n=1 Tax=Streptacidiphilus sp. MAP12-16 TaxID=3156300 RepID=UPI003518FB0D